MTNQTPLPSASNGPFSDEELSDLETEEAETTVPQGSLTVEQVNEMTVEKIEATYEGVENPFLKELEKDSGEAGDFDNDVETFVAEELARREVEFDAESDPKRIRETVAVLMQSQQKGIPPELMCLVAGEFEVAETVEYVRENFPLAPLQVVYMMVDAQEEISKQSAE